MKELKAIVEQIEASFPWLTCTIDDGSIIAEQDYECDEETDAGDVADAARETGQVIEVHFPRLEMTEYYCHRCKYAITEFKLK